MAFEIITYRTIGIILILIVVAYVFRFWWTREGKSKKASIYNNIKTALISPDNNDPREENTNTVQKRQLPRATLYSKNGCMYCDNLKPQWEIFIKNPNVEAWEVNCDNMETPPHSDIEGYPTVVFEDDEKRLLFVGPQTERQLVEFLYNNFYDQK